MNNITFKTGAANRLENGTAAVIDGETTIDENKVVGFRVELSSTDKHSHCSGLCTIKLSDLLTMSGADFLKVSAIEQEITLTAIAAYRDWLDGADSVLSGILAFVDSKSFSNQF